MGRACTDGEAKCRAMRGGIGFHSSECPGMALCKCGHNSETHACGAVQPCMFFGCDCDDYEPVRDNDGR